MVSKTLATGWSTKVFEWEKLIDMVVEEPYLWHPNVILDICEVHRLCQTLKKDLTYTAGCECLLHSEP